MARTKKPEPSFSRNPNVTRLCRYCARPYRETEFPEGGWVCGPCGNSGILPIIPLLPTSEGARYDTSTLFAGYKVVRNPPKGERVAYENEVHSPAGVFYAVAEAAFAFETKTTKMGNILQRQFPEARVQASGDDGCVVLIFPARLDLFQAVAKKVGAYRPRKVTDETRAKLAAAREVIEQRRQRPEQIGLEL
jgi:hypothetical protein